MTDNSETELPYIRREFLSEKIIDGSRHGSWNIYSSEGYGMGQC